MSRFTAITNQPLISVVQKKEETMSNGLDRVLDAISFVKSNLTNHLKPSYATTRLGDFLADAPKLSLETGPFLTGGSLVRAIVGVDSVNDFDVFCLSYEQAIATRDHYLSKSYELVTSDEEYGKFDLVKGDLKVQICLHVKRGRYQAVTPESTMLIFDFHHCMLATDGTTLLAHEAGLKSLETRAISMNPRRLRSLDKNLIMRLAKYTAMGFTHELTAAEQSRPSPF